MDDDLLPEYDFTKLTIVDRGERRKKSNITPAEWNKIGSNNSNLGFINDSAADINTTAY